MVLVARFEKPLHVGHIVAVDALEPFRGKTHGGDAIGNVGQIQVELGIDKTPLLLGHQGLDAIDETTAFFFFLLAPARTNRRQ